jgi:ribosomal protein L32
MAQTCRVIAGLKVYISGGSATATRLDLGGNIVVPSSAFFPSLPATLGITRIGRNRFQGTLDMFITISRHVQILCSRCFSSCESLLSISFEIDSELMRIESYAFYSCSSLKSITIPHHVQILCSRCFSSCESLLSISFEIDSELMRIESSAFYSCSSLKSITIPHHVQILCSGCFLFCESLSSISFEIDSELMRIESSAFCSCSSLKSITIPHRVQILCSRCFADCKSLSSISFEIDSELRHIEAEAFTGTCLDWVVLPEVISFIAADAFPLDCTITLTGVRDGHGVDVCGQCFLRNI